MVKSDEVTMIRNRYNRIPYPFQYSNNMSQLMRLRYLSHRQPAKAQASLRTRAVSPEPSLFAHISMEVDERSDQKSDNWPHWTAAHARLNNEIRRRKGAKIS